ncbi:MAG: hypothetical protein AB1486_12230 [Planctomycetota bacterium]
MHFDLGFTEDAVANAPAYNKLLPPVRTLLIGVEGLVPEDLGDADLTEWLSTPLAGVPLYERLVEPLRDIPLTSLEVAGSRVAERLVNLLAKPSVLPCVVRALELPLRPTLPPGVTLLLPGWGLPVLDAIGLVGLSGGCGGHRWVAVAELQDEPGAAAVTLPPGLLHFEELLTRPTVEAAIRVARQASCPVALQPSGALYPTHTVAALDQLARLCFQGERLALELTELACRRPQAVRALP